jgi:predicted transcriptional regulator
VIVSAAAGDNAEFGIDEEELELEERESEDPTAPREPRFGEVSETAALVDIYQRVRQLIPVDQDLLTVDAGTSALEGLRVLGRNSYSQVPVIRAGRCIGVFSYRSFAQTVAIYAEGNLGVAQVSVEDCLAQVPYVRLEDNIEDIFEALDRYDAVLVGQPTGLIAIASPMDALEYLYEITNGYVLMRQIELALRYVIQSSTSSDTLAECISAAVAQKYKQQGRNAPLRLEDMDLSDLRSIIVSGRTREHFAAVVGNNVDLVKIHLAPLTSLRNDVLHFRRKLSADEYERLAKTRDWLHLRIDLAGTRSMGSAS